MANSGRDLVTRPEMKGDKYDKKAMRWYRMQLQDMRRQQREEQDWSAHQALLDRQFQAEQAQNQMNFQQNMSDTAHQREVADLKAAGLNPVLSAGGSGASSPAGASASGAQANFVSSIVDSMPTLFNSVMSMAEAQRQQAEAVKQAQRSSARVVYRQVKKEENEVDPLQKLELEHLREQDQKQLDHSYNDTVHGTGAETHKDFGFHPSEEKKKIITIETKQAMKDVVKAWDDLRVSLGLSERNPVRVNGSGEQMRKFITAAYKAEYKLGKDVYTYPFRLVKSLQSPSANIRKYAIQKLQDDADYARMLIRR